MKKILSSTVIAVFAMTFFIGGVVPQAQATLSSNAGASVVVGQANMTSNDINQDGNTSSVDSNKFYMPRSPFFDGSKFFVVDSLNSRILIYNSIPTENNAGASVVIGQPNMTSNSVNQGASVAANTLFAPSAVFSDGTKLIICDSSNNRILIFNSIPTSNNASADVVIGQPDMTSNTANQGGTVAANTMYSPTSIFFDGKRLFVSDWTNNRVLIFNSLPTSNNASADIVIGQGDLISNGINEGSSVAANTLYRPNGIFFNGKKLFIADQYNNRILIFNSVPTSNNASADIVVGQQNMTSGSENQGASVAANTLNMPTHVYAYGPKLLILDASNQRLLIFNSIPTSNNASADTVIGQANMISNSVNQGASVGANTFYHPRGIFVANSKLMVGDYMNSRVLIYNSFGSQWSISKNHSRTLSGDEKIKVKKKKIEFTGKKTAWKKGRVRVFRNGSLVRTVKIKGNGKWKAIFKDTGSAVKDYVIKYYNKNGTLQMNSETYTLGINRGSLVESTLEKKVLSGKDQNKNYLEKSSQVLDVNFSEEQKAGY